MAYKDIDGQVWREGMYAYSNNSHPRWVDVVIYSKIGGATISGKIVFIPSGSTIGYRIDSSINLTLRNCRRVSSEELKALKGQAGTKINLFDRNFKDL